MRTDGSTHKHFPLHRASGSVTQRTISLEQVCCIRGESPTRDIPSLSHNDSVTRRVCCTNEVISGSQMLPEGGHEKFQAGKLRCCASTTELGGIPLRKTRHQPYMRASLKGIHSNQTLSNDHVVIQPYIRRMKKLLAGLRAVSSLGFHWTVNFQNEGAT